MGLPSFTAWAFRSLETLWEGYAASARWRSVRLEEFATELLRRRASAQVRGRGPRVPATKGLHGLQESTLLRWVFT